MRKLAIIQARLGSTRLPGKVLAEVEGRPMLRWLLDRARAVEELDAVIVATTLRKEDDRLVEWLEQQRDVSLFRGSESDVLDRYYQCAVQFRGDLIVRLTADDPLKDPSIVRRALSILGDGAEVEYCSNSLHPTFPEGLDVEAFTFAALERAHREARLPSEREHVTPYIWKHPELFKLRNFENDEDLSAWRWTVDKPQDLEFVRAVYSHFRDRPLVGYQEVIAFLKENPAILEINRGTVRREGYLKSLKADPQ